MKITIDKIASVTKNVPLSNSVETHEKIKAENGAIIVAQVLDDKKIYNKLELISGRLSTLQKGDLILVALGNRKALKGFVGEVPKKLQKGDIINLLNLGGVAGVCTSENFHEVGHALKIKVKGAVLNGKKQLNINQFKLFEKCKKLKSKTPLIIVSGTCMNVGKTTVASEIIKHLHRKKLKIFGAKLAGIAAMRDTEEMKDHGAKKAVSFVDAGLTSTVHSNGLSLEVSKGAINYLSEENPDFIIIEFGDGLYGEYGVMDILKDKEIQKNIIAHVGCAHDPVGAIKLAEICKKIGAPLNLISGPVSDNQVGSNFINKNLKISAINALAQSDQLFNYLSKKCLKLMTYHALS